MILERVNSTFSSIDAAPVIPIDILSLLPLVLNGDCQRIHCQGHNSQLCVYFLLDADVLDITLLTQVEILEI